MKHTEGKPKGSHQGREVCFVAVAVCIKPGMAVGVVLL